MPQLRKGLTCTQNFYLAVFPTESEPIPEIHATCLPFLSDVLDTITPKEKEILTMRYGLENGIPMFRSEVESKLGPDVYPVRTYEDRAIRKLRKPQRAQELQLIYKTPGELVQEIYNLRNDNDEKLRQIQEELDAKTAQLEGIVSGLSDTQREQLEDLEVDISVASDSYTPIKNLDLSVRAYNCCARAGIKYAEDLTFRTINDMWKVRNLGRESIDEIRYKLWTIGLHLKGDRLTDDFVLRLMNELEGDIIASTDISADDDAIIAETLQNLGYEPWNLEGKGLSCAMRAVRFAMNNPKPTAKLYARVWPEIAKHENISVRELTAIVSESVENLNPVWKKFRRWSRESDIPKDEVERNILEYAEKVLYGVDGHGVYDNVRYMSELISIGRCARLIKESGEAGSVLRLWW